MASEGEGSHGGNIDLDAEEHEHLQKWTQLCQGRHPSLLQRALDQAHHDTNGPNGLVEGEPGLTGGPPARHRVHSQEADGPATASSVAAQPADEGDLFSGQSMGNIFDQLDADAGLTDLLKDETLSFFDDPVPPPAPLPAPAIAGRILPDHDQFASPLADVPSSNSTPASAPPSSDALFSNPADELPAEKQNSSPDQSSSQGPSPEDEDIDQKYGEQGHFYSAPQSESAKSPINQFTPSRVSFGYIALDSESDTEDSDRVSEGGTDRMQLDHHEEQHPQHIVRDKTIASLTCRRPRVSDAVEQIKAVQTFAQQLQGLIGGYLSDQLEKLKHGDTQFVDNLDTEMEDIVIDNPLVQAKIGETLISIGSAAVNVWHDHTFQPVSGPKDVSAILLHPPFPDYSEVTDTFWRGILQAYREQSLGKLAQLDEGDGDTSLRQILESGFPWSGQTKNHQSMDEDAPDMLSSWAPLCSVIGQLDALRLSSIIRPTIVYLVCPSGSPATIWEYCTIFDHIRQAYIDKKDPEHRRQAAEMEPELVLQLIPCDWFLAERGPRYPSHAEYRALARETYDRAPQFRPRFAWPWESPAISLTPPPDAAPRIQRKGKEVDRQPRQRVQLHMAVAVCEDSKWVSVAMTNQAGSKRYCTSYRLSFESPLFLIAQQALADLKELCFEGDEGIEYVVNLAQLGPMSREEGHMWTHVFEKSPAGESMHLRLLSSRLAYPCPPLDPLTSPDPDHSPEHIVTSPPTPGFVLSPAPLLTTGQSPMAASPGYAMSPMGPPLTPMAASSPLPTPGTPHPRTVSSMASQDIPVEHFRHVHDVAHDTVVKYLAVEEEESDEDEPERDGGAALVPRRSVLLIKRGQAQGSRAVRLDLLQDDEECRFEDMIRSFAGLWTLQALWQGKADGPWHCHAATRAIQGLGTIFPDRERSENDD